MRQGESTVYDSGVTDPTPAADRREPITVLVVDDDHWTTRGLAYALGVAPGVRLLGAVHSGEEAIRAYQAEPADVVLMDINMGAGITGIEATEQILELNPRARVVILTTVTPGPGLIRAIDVGACAVVRKDASDAMLLETVRRAARGDDPSLLGGLARQMRQVQARVESATVPQLTDAEHEELKLICAGLSYSEIAEKRHISPHTAEAHARRLREKFGVKSLAQVILKAVEFRFVDL